MSETGYVHGYDRTEQERLVAQAAYWRELIRRGLSYRPGETVLEIGCGVGAVLGILGAEFPGVQLAGIDIEPAQIDYARVYLPSIGQKGVDLRAGDACELPWLDGQVDHVFLIWVLEHVANPLTILKEARRVLKPGGTITLTETDYGSIALYPSSPEYERFLDAYVAYFNKHGDAHIGRALGVLLDEAGFSGVENEMIGFHCRQSWEPDKLRHHVEYLGEFMEPMLGEIAASTGVDSAELRKGFDFFKRAGTREGGALSHVFYRGSGRR